MVLGPALMLGVVIVIVVGSGKRRKPTGCVRDNGVIAPVAPSPC